MAVRFLSCTWAILKVRPRFQVAKSACKAKYEVKAGVHFREVQGVSIVYSSSRQDADRGMDSTVYRIRGYMELLDDYSMYNFVIWKGNAVRHAPEFTSLACTYEPVWSSMDACITILEKVMAINDAPLAVIDGKKLSELANFDLAQVDAAHLCSCIVNLEKIHSLPCPTTIKTSESKRKNVAITIQAIARRFLMSSKISFLTHRRNAAVKLQCLARGMRSRRLVSELFVRHRRDDESKWEGLQANLKTN